MPTKILAIDDSKTMRLAIKITFAAEDAKVTAVSKGSEAVARAKQMQADVILVDHKLGDGEPSGLEVVAALKANAATANIPVILLVPAKGGVNEAQITAAGADAYIGKPFDSQDLIDKVAASLGRAVAKPAAAAKPVAAAAAAVAPPAATAARKPAATPPAATPVAAPPVAAAAKPPVATPPAAVPPVATPPAAARKPAATPAVPAAAAKPAAVPAAAAAKPAAVPAAAKPVAPAPTPARTPAATPAPTPSPVAAKPAPAAAKPAATPAAATPAATPMAARAPAGGVPAQIPIAMPIPFTAANSPTPGMLERLKAAGGGAAAGLDPGAIRALLQLSHEVVEQIVWEVVPDLAEEIIKQKVR